MAFLTVAAVWSPPRWAAVPPDIQRHIHVRAEDVPAYPDSDSLMHVQLWPRMRVFDGDTCVLEFHAGQYDASIPHVQSLSEIGPGWSYGAHYVRRSDMKGMWVGPSYYWRSDSTLSERGFRTTQWMRVWNYKPNGDLYLLQSWNYDSTNSDEWFGDDGTLIACRVGGKYYWMGVETQEGVGARAREAITWK
jgi:hypothetical protein